MFSGFTAFSARRFTPVLKLHPTHLHLSLSSPSHYPLSMSSVASSLPLFTYLGQTNPLPPPSPLPSPYVIGLCGGIASGKSSVSSHLSSLGVSVLDCDKLAHSLYSSSSSSLYHQLIELFGQQIITQDESKLIDRRALGRIVFSSPSELQKLNSLMWPAIFEELKQKIKQENQSPVIVVEAAILIEAGWFKRENNVFHEIWVVQVDREEAIRRLEHRNGLSSDEANKRLNSQTNNQQRANHADLLISTETPVEITKKNIENVWKQLKERIGLEQ
jgi:phosphopantetheine adenylyltransferase/dephospho-CoA kinase